MKLRVLCGVAAILSLFLLACGTRPSTGGGPAWSGPIRESNLVPSASSPTPVPERLFETDIPLSFTLEADFRQLRRDRGQESPERPGRVVLEGYPGQHSFPVEVSTRGRFRLNDYICSFPPLRLDFPSDSLRGSVLEGLDKVKLVTHCQDKDSYEQNVLEEYLTYRIYGLLTNVGFRVQLALITYRDTADHGEEVSRLAFLIEDKDAMARRLGGEIMEVEQVHPDHLVPAQAGLMYLFQFLIGNTDWALGEIHNMEVLRIGQEYYPIPFDFDFSGFVDTPYAGPSPVVAQYITDVRDRYYWGVCSPRIDFPALFSHFNGAREPILELIRKQEGLTGWSARRALLYVEAFYDIINSEREAGSSIVGRCRSIRR